jgi:hypothetical protein
MREFGILFDGSSWVVLERFSDSAPANVLQTCSSLEEAVRAIYAYGGPVLLKVVTEGR